MNEVFEKVFTEKDEFPNSYVEVERDILLSCQQILQEESMLDEDSDIPGDDEFWVDSDVQAYLEQRMQTAETELKAGKTVSLRTSEV